MYSESDLDKLINESILGATDMPYVSMYSTTDAGMRKVRFRIKQHILVRGIANVDTALGLVETELSTPNTQD
jgi:hypothetical protein